MSVQVKLHSKKTGELNKFLSEFYNTDMELEKKLKWEKNYANPIEITDIISAFVDNIENFNIKMWISLDKDIFIKVSEQNANDIIKYLFERYPY
jgi:lipopolysaccharide biosynthesis protein